MSAWLPKCQQVTVQFISLYGKAHGTCAFTPETNVKSSASLEATETLPPVPPVHSTRPDAQVSQQYCYLGITLTSDATRLSCWPQMPPGYHADLRCHPVIMLTSDATWLSRWPQTPPCYHADLRRHLVITLTSDATWLSRWPQMPPGYHANLRRHLVIMLTSDATRLSCWPQTPPGYHADLRCHLAIMLTSGATLFRFTSTSLTRQAGPWASWEELWRSVPLQRKAGPQVMMHHTNTGICKLLSQCLGPKQYQADQPPEVSTVKGSATGTAEVPQNIQCQWHAHDARLATSSTQTQESKNRELLSFISSTMAP